MADEQYIPLSVLRSYSPHPDKLDLTGLTQDEITHGIKSSKLPDYIRYKQYLTDTNEALAQLAEMIIQFAVNLSLDPDQTLDWARKLQQAVPQSEFDSWIATLLDGGPSIFMNTLSELQAKYPNGAAGVALVRETDPAKIYVWNGSAWEDFGDYQGIAVKENTIGTQHVLDKAITYDKTNFINGSTNLLDMNDIVLGKVISSAGLIVDNSGYAYSHRINATGGENITTRGVMFLACFGVNGFIERLAANDGGVSTTQLPSNTTYFIACFTNYSDEYKNGTIQINKGLSLSTFSPYKELLSEKVKISEGNIEDDFKLDKRNVGFVKVSSNLFNKDDIVVGKIINDSGEIVDNGSYAYSHPIEIKGGESITTLGIVFLVFYTSNDEYISPRQLGYDGAVTTTIAPPKSAYCRLIFRPYGDFYEQGKIQANKGNILLPYEDNHSTLADDLVVSERNLDIINISSNLLNLNDITNYNVIGGTGEIVSNTGYAYSHPIDTSNVQKVTMLGVMYIALYDASGSFINRVAANEGNIFTLDVPTECKSIRVCFTNYSALFYSRKIQVNYGSELKPFEAFYKKLHDIEINKDMSVYDFKEDDQFVISGDTDSYYHAPTFPSKLDMENMKAEDVYSWFDSLVALYPHYIKRTSMGKDESGLFDVFRYDFKPQDVPDVEDLPEWGNDLKPKVPKMILISGIHAYERTHPWVLYLALKEICEAWENNSVLETLRWNVHFIVIPCANPHGWITGARHNFNKVDLARNFEYRWEQASAVQGSSKGMHPLSEVEAQYIDSVLRENKDETIFFTSLHNFESEEDWKYIWYPAGNALQLNIGKQLISRLTREWKKKYDWLPQNETTFLGYANRRQPLGGEGSQANLYGIQGGTFEISRILYLEDNPVKYSSNVITMGVETLINFLSINLKNGVDYYNKKGSITITNR